MDWKLVMSSFYHEESCFDSFNKWLDSLYENEKTVKQFMETYKDEVLSELVEKAFLEGFEAGRRRLNKENWDLWNQK